MKSPPVIDGQKSSNVRMDIDEKRMKQTCRLRIFLLEFAAERFITTMQAGTVVGTPMDQTRIQDEPLLLLLKSSDGIFDYYVVLPGFDSTPKYATRISKQWMKYVK
eukprot:441924_1